MTGEVNGAATPAAAFAGDAETAAAGPAADAAGEAGLAAVAATAAGAAVDPVTQAVTAAPPPAAEVGHCDLCGQELLRTAGDCWHPWNVSRACPPEPADSSSPEWADWWQAGNRTGRPGREHWRPGAPPPRSELPFGALLSTDELHALELLTEFVNLTSRIVGPGRTRQGDMNEIATRVHDLQHLVMAQAAARAYPDRFRLLGKTVGP